MGERNGLTLVEVIVVFFIILFILFLTAVIMPQLGKVKPIAQRVVCGTNLKGLGTAIVVYANDHDGANPELPGKGAWSKELGFDYSMTRPDFGPGGTQELAGRTISASWYLLVREADVSPKSFVCPSSSQEAFDGHVPNPPSGRYPDITELWDFGNDPYERVSYVLQNPYGAFAAREELGGGFAMGGDMSPWFEDGDFVAPSKTTGPQLITADDKGSYEFGNTTNHMTPKRRFKLFGRKREVRVGQNVLFADGHNSFEKSANCGVDKDNIYTFWSKDEEPSKQDRQGGTNPTARDEGNDARSKEDSFLGI